MIYRAPERTTPARGRAVTHELAALLVGMAILAAVILQFACAGVGSGGSTGRWLCVNNARLAALRGPTPTPTGTSPAGRSAGIRPITNAVPTPELAVGALETPTAPPSLGGAFAALPTTTVGNDVAGYPDLGAEQFRALPTQDTPLLSPMERRQTREAEGLAGGLQTLTAAAIADQAVRTATPTTTPDLPAGSSTPTPGPGTPSVTPGPSPSASASPTETGYP